MPYTFELSFRGLCVLTFAGQDLANPTEVNVLLLNARGLGYDDHLPYLSYQPHQVDGNPNPWHTLAPAPNCSQIALQKIARKRIEIVLPANYPRGLRADWRDRNQFLQLPETPDLAHPDQEKWLDWVMALQRVNSATPAPDPQMNPPFNGLKPPALVIARVRLTHGSLRADDFPRTQVVDPNTGRPRYVKWDFVDSNGNAAGPHAMAGCVVLSLPNIPESDAVGIRGQNFEVFLRARRRPDNGAFESTVRASITNLPAEEDPTRPDRLHHFAHYYDLVEFPQGAPPLKLPTRHGGTITSTTVFCPPTTHVKAQ